VVAKKESGAGLHAFPMSALGLHMDGEVIHVAMEFQVGSPSAIPTNAINAQVDHLAILTMPPLLN